VQTRNGLQVRSHAQKYMNKMLRKNRDLYSKAPLMAGSKTTGPIFKVDKVPRLMSQKPIFQLERRARRCEERKRRPRLSDFLCLTKSEEGSEAGTKGASERGFVAFKPTLERAASEFRNLSRKHV